MLIIAAHKFLEKFTLSKWQQYWKDQVGNWYGMFLHESQYMEPVMRDIEAMLESSQRPGPPDRPGGMTSSYPDTAINFLAILPDEKDQAGFIVSNDIEEWAISFKDYVRIRRIGSVD